MKRSVKLLILLGVLVLAALGTKLIKETDFDVTESTEDTSVTFFSIDEEKLENISWEYNGETQTLLYYSGSWEAEGMPADFALDMTYGDAILASLKQLKAVKVIENVTDLSKYGLEEPTRTLTVVQGGESTVLVLGDATTQDGYRYVSIGDGKVYICDTDLVSQTAYTAADMEETEAETEASEEETAEAADSSEETAEAEASAEETAEASEEETTEAPEVSGSTEN